MICPAQGVAVPPIATSSALSADQAFAEIQRRCPDLVLLDQMLPDVDGLEICRRLRASPRTKRVPIIFLTARAEFRDGARGLDIGGVDYITKPFNPVELAPLVRGLLERLDRGERDELRHEKLTELRSLMSDG